MKLLIGSPSAEMIPFAVMLVSSCLNEPRTGPAPSPRVPFKQEGAETCSGARFVQAGKGWARLGEMVVEAIVHAQALRTRGFQRSRWNMMLSRTRTLLD